MGLKQGPVISDDSWAGSGIRQNGATSPSGVMTTTSKLPPSSATNRSPEPSSTVMLSTPVSGWRSPVPSQINVYCCARRSTACTRLSVLVVNQMEPSWYQMPSPPGVRKAPGTCSRVGVSAADGSGTAAQVTDPSSPTSIASSVPELRSG